MANGERKYALLLGAALGGLIGAVAALLYLRQVEREVLEEEGQPEAAPLRKRQITLGDLMRLAAAVIGLIHQLATLGKEETEKAD
ncbi:MAG: hypothetical protein ACE5NP_10385 [Anaerolineae bacterium]